MNKVVRLGTVPYRDKKRMSVFCRVQIREDGELSIVGVEGPLQNGNALGGCGQIIMSLDPRRIEPAPGWDAAKIHRFLELWNQWHLNHMRAGCRHQRERGEHEVGKPCDVCDHRYGSWLKEELPQHVVEFMQSLPETDKMCRRCQRWFAYLEQKIANLGKRETSMNGLTLIIVNDGNGDQCGATYHDRLRVARMSQDARNRSWWLMVERAEAWHRAHEGEAHNIAYEREAVAELDHYYQQHIKEL